MSTAVRRAIYGKLSGDSTLTNMLGAAPTGYTKAIYHDPAPEGTGFPFVVLSKSSGIPTESFGSYTNGGTFAYETDVWLIKAVDQSPSADVAEGIAARITTLLNDASLSISGGTTMYLRRQSDVEYSEVIDGETFRHAGSQYRLLHE